MADLQRSFSFYTRKEILYEEFMDGIFSHLFLDRVVLLEMVVGKKALKPISSRGFKEEEKDIIKEVLINIPDDFLNQKKSLMVSSEIDSNDFEKLLERQLQTPYFILIPLVKNQQVWGAYRFGVHCLLVCKMNLSRFPIYHFQHQILICLNRWPVLFLQ